MDKAPEAFRTITEAAEELDLPAHVLRFWEGKFGQLRPLKRAGGRRLYRPDDLALLRGIRDLIYVDGLTIKAVQRVIREQGVGPVRARGREGPPPEPVRSRRPRTANLSDLPPWEDPPAEPGPDRSRPDHPAVSLPDAGAWPDDGRRPERPAAPDADGPDLDGRAEDGGDGGDGLADRHGDGPGAVGSEGAGSGGAPARPVLPAAPPAPVRIGQGDLAPGLALRRALARLEEARAVLARVAREPCG